MVKALLAALTLIGAAVFAAPSTADVVSFVGDTTGSPTYNRLSTMGLLSNQGTNVNYAVQGFTTSLSGDYVLNENAAFDTFLSLYADSFDPMSPLTNFVAADDDGGSGTNSRLVATLTANRTYFLVPTAFSNGDAGAFNAVITGPGIITLAAAPGAPAPLLGLGLLPALAAAGGLVAMRRRRKTVLSPALA